MKFAVAPFVATLAMLLLAIAPTTVAGEERLLRAGNNDQQEKEPNQDSRNLSPSPIAVTAWWALFHKPEKCAGGSGACSPAAGDIADHQTKAAVFYCSGGFTDPVTGDIVLAGATFKASNSIKDVGMGLADINPAPEGALDRLFLGGDPEILLVVRSHGMKVDDPAMARAQIMGFNEPSCDVNTCANIQIVRFVSGEEGEKSLVPIGGDGTPVAGSSVFLNRQGDALQVVIKTTVTE